MKIVTLNTWGGRAGKENLLRFFDAHRDIDIFCLQEIWSAPYEHLEGANAGGVAIDHSTIMTEGMQEISSLLSDHQAYFRPAHGDNYGLMMLVKKDIVVIEESEFFVYKEKGFVPTGDAGFHARNVQYIRTRLNDREVSIMHFHGLWNGKGKGDSADRIEQSRKTLEFIKNLDHDVVVCGDFNILPSTQSLQMFEDAGLRNLVREYGVTSTRTSLYTKPEKYADYIFTTHGVKVLDFKVLPDEVSDHAPLYLECE